MSIRTRIFLVFILAMLAGFGLLARWMHEEVNEFYNQSFEEVLVDTANVFAELVAQDLRAGNQQLEGLQAAITRTHAREFSANIYTMEKHNIDLRIYVTDARGIVIFDSDNSKAVGEDYANWRDVSITLRGGYGARASDEIQVDASGATQTVSVAYVAAPVVSDGTIIGVVSIGKPKTNIEKFVQNARQDVLIAVLLSVLFAMLLALLLYLWVSRPLQALLIYAEKTMRGERANPPLDGGQEIRKVGQAMADMRAALENKHYVERYVQTLTHEIKSPLTAIQAAAELLGGELPDSKRQQFSEDIITEAARLNDFANHLLRLAAVENRSRLDARDKVNLATLLDDLAASLQPVLASKKLSLQLQIQDDITVHGDAFLLRQAIENLLRNAIDFSPEHGCIHVQTTSVNTECDIIINDDGQGIPDYALPQVFERFYSLPRPSGKKSTGLGLNFVREVAELHHGSIVIANRQPRGVRAVLHLPCSNA